MAKGFNEGYDAGFTQAREACKILHQNIAPQLLALVKQYRQEAISQGADVSDVQEIDKVLRLAGEDI